MKTDSDGDTPLLPRVEDSRDPLLNSEAPPTDLLLSNLNSPVTDGIRDISSSPDWQAGITGCLFLQSRVQSTSPTMWFFLEGSGGGGEGRKELESSLLIPTTF